MLELRIFLRIFGDWKNVVPKFHVTAQFETSFLKLLALAFLFNQDFFLLFFLYHSVFNFVKEE